MSGMLCEDDLNGKLRFGQVCYKRVRPHLPPWLTYMDASSSPLPADYVTSFRHFSTRYFVTLAHRRREKKSGHLLYRGEILIERT
jgi:hypothetical protein